LRLSGDGGEADGVRCSRGLGGMLIEVPEKPVTVVANKECRHLLVHDDNNPGLGNGHVGTLLGTVKVQEISQRLVERTSNR